MMAKDDPASIKAQRPWEAYQISRRPVVSPVSMDARGADALAAWGTGVVSR
jgi:hypothetical protein